MKKFAFLFPGQGSQTVGMGKDLVGELAGAKEMFDLADATTGLPISRLCFEGPMADLTQTVNLQPAVTAVNLALLGAIEAAGIRPAVCAGHSLGEYSALRAAGVVSNRDCLKLVYERGRLMHREATAHKGAMAAVVGLDIAAVDRLVSQAAEQGIVSVANHNSAEQIVITGAPGAVAAAGELAKAQGARAIPLKVSGAWHSRLIQGAETDFQSFLDNIDFLPPSVPVLHNVTAGQEKDPGAIRHLMARQLCRPVRWYDTMLAMQQADIDVYVEVGPGKVLAGLLKKTLPPSAPAKVVNVRSLKSLKAFLEAMA